MNYRHQFHAGNFADVMKHTLLYILLQALNRKSAAWCYFDTHAGRGSYDLRGEAALKTAEAGDGIMRVWPVRAAAPATGASLCAIVGAFNPALEFDAAPRFYPGSPAVAAALARPQDRLVLAELQPQEARVLRQHFHSDSRVAVHACDGYEMLAALVPPPERRGLVLMDPAFEQADEFVRLLTVVQAAHARWPAGIYALWYPLKDMPMVTRFERGLIQSGMHRILLAEFRIAPAGTPGFYACGMAIINPPWQSDQHIRINLEFLEKVLAPGGIGGHQVRWLVEE